MEVTISQNIFFVAFLIISFFCGVMISKGHQQKPLQLEVYKRCVCFYRGAPLMTTNEKAIINDMPFAYDPEELAQHEDDEIISVIINVPAPKNQGCDIDD